jgi:hypothetical protein
MLDDPVMTIDGDKAEMNAVSYNLSLDLRRHTRREVVNSESRYYSVISVDDWSRPARGKPVRHCKVLEIIPSGIGGYVSYRDFLTVVHRTTTRA